MRVSRMTEGLVEMGGAANTSDTQKESGGLQEPPAEGVQEPPKDLGVQEPPKEAAAAQEAAAAEKAATEKAASEKASAKAEAAKAKPVATPDIAKIIKAQPDDWKHGPDNAKVTIIEWGDFQ